MFKTLIVDDELIVLEAVKFIIENNIDQLEIVGTARNGREAIEKAEKLNPDIILMDIRMPGINGIDAIKEIREENNRIKFVILSAYEQFEFAKEAVNLGVKEYILKPINRYKLIETLNKLIVELQEEEKKKKKELENIEKLRNVLPILENGFIFSILLNTDFQEELERYKTLFDLSFDYGYIMVIEFGEGKHSESLENKIGSSVKSHKFYPALRDMLKYKRKCIVGPSIINRIIAFISIEQPKDEYKQRLHAIQFASDIVKKMKRNSDIEFYIGIGGFSRIDELYYSYEEALKALRVNNGQEVIHIADVVDEYNASGAQFRDLSKKLITAIETGIEQDAMKILNKLFDILRDLNTMDKKNKIMELIVYVYRAAIEQGIEEDAYINYNTYLEEILKLDYREHLQWCMKKVNYITKKINEDKRNKVSKLINNACHYIHEHYNKDITLEDVSRHVGLSPQYFSRLFKEETSDNFIQFLTNTRINQAKKLIKESNQSIKEICFQVGYKDPNYFSRLFKKTVGITPTEFIKNA